MKQQQDNAAHLRAELHKGLGVVTAANRDGIDRDTKLRGELGTKFDEIEGKEKAARTETLKKLEAIRRESADLRRKDPAGDPRVAREIQEQLQRNATDVAALQQDLVAQEGARKAKDAKIQQEINKIAYQLWSFPRVRTDGVPARSMRLRAAVE